MADTRPPAFQFYARDWLAGKRCRMLRPAERGAYVDLMAVQWMDGTIPTDEEELTDLLRGLGYAPGELRLDRLCDLFPGGKNERLEKERAKQAEYRAKKADAGRKGANARWHSDSTANGSANAKAIANDGPASASSTANTSSVLSEPPGGDVEKPTEEPPWNRRLAPPAREAGGESHLSDWLQYARHNPDEYERILIGFVSLRERGALKPKVAPGQLVSPAVLALKSEGQPIEKLAIKEYWRLDRMPKRTNGTLDRLTVGGTDRAELERSAR